MPRPDVLERCIWWLTIIGHLALYIRLRMTGLHHTYRFFSGYLLFRVVRAALLMGVPWGVSVFEREPNVPFATNAYGYLWAATEPVVWVFWVLVVLELYSLVLQNYKGIASLGRWVLLAGLVIALMVSALTLHVDLSNADQQFHVLRYFSVIDRGVVSSLVVFLLFISCFLAWYPVPLSRNVVVHCIVYAAYFLSLSLVVLLRNLTGNAVTQTVNILLSCVTLVCLVVWTALLNQQGERKAVRIRPPAGAQEEQALVEHLAAINSTLLRAARK